MVIVFITLCYISGMFGKKLEKGHGHTHVPVKEWETFLFIGDLNMAEVDRCGMVQSHALIQQHIDYGHWWACAS